MAESLDSHVGVRDDVGVVSKKLERRASEIVDELVSTLRPCGHCGRIMGDFAGGYAKVGEIEMCHPSAMGRPDCYHLVTVYKHKIENCDICSWRPGRNFE